MLRWFTIGLLATLLVLADSIASPGDLSPLASAADPTPFVCEPSVPNHVPAPPDLAHYVDPKTSFFGDGIWANIPKDGQAWLGKDSMTEEGPFANWRGSKMLWTRGPGVIGPLVVTGERTDAPAPQARDSFFSHQYGSQGFTPVGLIFPTPGCWEITGRVSTHKVVFTLEVHFAAPPSSATPAA